jgi:hypothetical protein
MDATANPTARKKRGKEATPEGKAARIAALRASSSKSPSQSNAVAALANPDRPLTQMQRDFVKHWAQGETIMSASVRAGYADHGTIAYKLAKDPAILKIYNREKVLYEEASQMTRKKVMDMLLEAYDAAKLMSEPSSMVAAAREVGKMCGYYEAVKRTIDINVSGDVTVKRLERMSDGDLLKLIKGEVEEVAFNEIEEGEDGEDSE